MRDNKFYIEKEVYGILCSEEAAKKTKSNLGFVPGKVIVRYTHDKEGKSISFQFRDIMISIPCEDLEDVLIIEEVE